MKSIHTIDEIQNPWTTQDINLSGLTVIKNPYVFLCVLFDRTCLILQLYILDVIRKSVHKSRNTIQAQINVYSCDPLLKSLLSVWNWISSNKYASVDQYFLLYKPYREPWSFAVVKLNMKSEHSLVFALYWPATLASKKDKDTKSSTNGKGILYTDFIQAMLPTVRSPVPNFNLWNLGQIWVFHDKEVWPISVRLSDRSKVTRNKINFVTNCPQWGLNPQLPDHHSNALPTELGRNLLGRRFLKWALFASCITSNVGLCSFLESIEHDLKTALMIHSDNQIVT